MGFGLARKSELGDIGIKGSYLYFGIYDQVADGLTFDVGFSKLLKNGIGIGVSILNLGYMSKLYEEKPKLPIVALAGISKDLSYLRAKSRVFSTIEYSALNNRIFSISQPAIYIYIFIILQTMIRIVIECRGGLCPLQHIIIFLVILLSL